MFTDVSTYIGKCLQLYTLRGTVPRYICHRVSIRANFRIFPPTNCDLLSCGRVDLSPAGAVFVQSSQVICPAGQHQRLQMENLLKAKFLHSFLFLFYYPQDNGMIWSTFTNHTLLPISTQLCHHSEGFFSSDFCTDQFLHENQILAISNAW